MSEVPLYGLPERPLHRVVCIVRDVEQVEHAKDISQGGNGNSCKPSTPKALTLNSDL